MYIARRHYPFVTVATVMSMIALLLFVFTPALAEEEVPSASDGLSTAPSKAAPLKSPRLIIALESAPLAQAFAAAEVQAAGINGKLDVNAASAQAYMAQLQAEQGTFVNQMQSVLAEASIATYINELGLAEQATYQIVFNGMAVEVPSGDLEAARAKLERLDGVKNVYFDKAYSTHLYTSTHQINAPAVWDSSQIGGVENAGAGVKFASMDGGVHKDAPMMDGTGYEYPSGYGPDGLGLTANNNGKIIASRVYFRSWDPPAPGDENPWPGENGTSHGIHTASTAAGGCVDNVEYIGFNVGSMCGVAPKAYVMSYRVFYASVNGNDSFYTAEGVAALEDIVKDGADVVQNSWGEGPITEGGEFDPIDQALINAVKAGVFVSMSAGNSGPGKGTGDHPSDDYINVAASTTSGTLAAGQVNVVGNSDLQGLPYGTASFGPSLALGELFTYPYVTAASVDPANVTGCSAFPEGAFEGKAALISRGGCFFSDKAYYAQQAGAVFAIIYNNTGGEALINMSCGSFCGEGEITITSIMIGETNGNAAVEHYDMVGADSASVEVSTIGFQSGNIADRIIGFSSRGPGIGGTLKPDIAAPGVNILAQGYANGVTGEDRHLGYGQVSGTSMAGPHVAGAAVLLKQLYPGWSNAFVKSALMSTAQYMDIYNFDGTPAQPLDMGAGRLDVGAAMDPGVILDPPSVSFSTVPSGTQKSVTVQVTNISASPETYILSTLSYTDSFTNTSSLAGVTLSADSITLAPGETKSVDITFDSSQSNGVGDNQGYILMEGSEHKAHMAAWARVTPASQIADVLILDNDFSSLAPLAGLFAYDYLWYYTSALDELGYTYEVVDVDANFGGGTTIPEAAVLAGYKAILHFTGDNFRPDGTFGVSTGITALDKDRLVEYLNGGGTIVAMGQDLSSVANAAVADAAVGNRDFYYVYRLGANYIQDSVTGSGAAGEFTPAQMIIPSASAPDALQNMSIDLTQVRKYTASGSLSGDEEVPAVMTEAGGNFTIYHDVTQNMTEFAVTIVPTPTEPITVTSSHIHLGTAGNNGGVVRNLNLSGVLPAFVTDTLTLSGVLSPSLTAEEIGQMLNGEFYINVHSSKNPGGEVRGQILPSPVPNQAYIDELENVFHDGSQDPNDDGTTSESNLGSVPLFYFGGPYNQYNGTVALAHRDQPSLERAGTDYSGRSIYASFGLEGMNEAFNPTARFTPTTRVELLGAFLDWGWSEPSTVVVSNTTATNASELRTFSATLASGQATQYRWDFGDGSAPVISGAATAGHHYTYCGIYTVRAEVTDSLGNVAIGSTTITIATECTASLSVRLNNANAGPVGPGELVSVQVKYENKGNATVSGMIKVTVPENTTYTAAGSSGLRAAGGGTWSCADGSAAGSVCELAVSNLASGVSDEATFAVTVDSNLPTNAGELNFAAEIEADGTTSEVSAPLVVSIASPTNIMPVEEPDADSDLEPQLYIPFMQ
ncbi:MAG: S8 family serine peptidase [Chloroflexota bacterium]